MVLLMIGAPEIIFITLIVLLLFGGKKIPELMKGLGKGMRSFQQGMKGEEQQDTSAQPSPQDNTEQSDKTSSL